MEDRINPMPAPIAPELGDLPGTTKLGHDAPEPKA
jgi:hypothetical protein